jgi:type II secretory pathway pseudopilin PulG
MKPHLSHLRSRQGGFTLAETLIALTIMLMALACTLTLFTRELKSYFYDSHRLQLNRDIRKFTQDMATDVAASSYFMIFTDFQTRLNGTFDGNLPSGNSGDFLVLVSNAICVPDASNNPSVNGVAYAGLTVGTNYVYQMIGYYRDVPSPNSNNATGPVRRVLYKFSTPIDPTAHAPAPINYLLSLAMPTANQSNQSTNPVVVQLAQGLAAGTLFYNVQQGAALVRAQIQENGNNSNAVNTYTFTVAPRG